MPPQPAAFKLSTVTKAAHYPGNTAPTPARRHWGIGASLAFLMLTGMLLAGCGGGSDVARRTPPPENPRQWPVVPPGNPAAANAVLMRAISLVGTPYLYGGNSPQAGFDCSGLVNYVYDDMLDIKLPRTSRALSEYQGPRIEPRQLSAADLVFFSTVAPGAHAALAG